ncbi:MAG TPA: hypothetical protein VHN17_06340 [Steroidobacteraceae bacterium]|nr:hypothetical protein [Steroidobacteraceae bacterium]
MILGMSTASFTLFHVVLSLIGIASGLVVMAGMWAGKRLNGWSALFLATTVATSVTGFLFHSAKFGPPHVIGLLSLVLLVLAILARYSYHLAGSWRWIYVVTAQLALYFNVFVAVVQAFQKLPLLQPLAPTGTEPPFAIAQGLVLVAFIAFTVLALKRFYPARDNAAVSMRVS